MAVDDVWQLHLHQRYAGQQILNTVTFRTKSAVTVDATVAQALAQDWKDMLLPLQISQVSHTGWALQQLRGGTAAWPDGLCRRDGGARLEGVYTGTVVGSIAGEGLPPQSAMVTTIVTGQSGRRHRGRFYLTGLSETIQDAGTIVAGTVTIVTTAWTGQFTQYGPSGTDLNWQIGIWSSREASGCRPRTAPPYGMERVEAPDPAAAYLNASGFIVRNIVYNQRRRTIGVGR